MDVSEFEELLEALRKDADQAVWFIGFLKAVVDNDEVQERLDNSFSGFAGITARAGVKNSAILYCARAWDGSEDAVSLRRAVENLPSLADLERRRGRKLMDTVGHVPNGRYLERYAEFMARYERARDNAYHPSIRLLRTEYFAHRLLKSRERKKLEDENAPVPDATYNDLNAIAEATVSLVGELTYLWDLVSDPYPERVERAARYCREFWRLVPVLRKVEKLDA